MKLEYSRQISPKKSRISNFMNIRPVGSRVVSCGHYKFYCSWRWAYKPEICRAKI